MFQQRLWGRPFIGWALDAGVVVLAILFLIGGDPTLRLLAVVLVVWRAVSVVTGVLVWRRTQGRTPGRR